MAEGSDASSCKIALFKKIRILFYHGKAGRRCAPFFCVVIKIFYDFLSFSAFKSS